VVSTILGCIYIIREPVKKGVFSFLSLNRPLQAEVLVIEGWITNRMFKEAAAEFLQGRYSYCLVSGKIYSSFSPAEVFMRYGIDSCAVRFTDSWTGNGHNTYHIALAARQWFRAHDPTVSTINVFTAGPHGRKSWIIFKRVFGRDCAVGVISSSINPEDTDLWWKTKRGTRAMAKYGIGYIYALLWRFDKKESLF
jgi:hypothetical protein